MTWIIQHWYFLFGMFGLCATLIAAIYFRRKSDTTAARIFFFLVPIADPKFLDLDNPNPNRLTRRALVLVAVGLLIVLLAILFVPGFA